MGDAMRATRRQWLGLVALIHAVIGAAIAASAALGLLFEVFLLRSCACV